MTFTRNTGTGAEIASTPGATNTPPPPPGAPETQLAKGRG
jgi:multiple sugar transport system permease protein/raffinose/stachyose/melibiose transport system permease protein